MKKSGSSHDEVTHLFFSCKFHTMTREIDYVVEALNEHSGHKTQSSLPSGTPRFSVQDVDGAKAVKSGINCNVSISTNG